MIAPPRKRAQQAVGAVLEGVGLGPLRKADTTRKGERVPAYALGRGTTAEAKAWAARPSFESPDPAAGRASAAAEWHDG